MTSGASVFVALFAFCAIQPTESSQADRLEVSAELVRKGGGFVSTKVAFAEISGKGGGLVVSDAVAEGELILVLTAQSMLEVGSAKADKYGACKFSFDTDAMFVEHRSSLKMLSGSFATKRGGGRCAASSCEEVNASSNEMFLSQYVDTLPDPVCGLTVSDVPPISSDY